MGTMMDRRLYSRAPRVLNSVLNMGRHPLELLDFLDLAAPMVTGYRPVCDIFWLTLLGELGAAEVQARCR